MTVKLIAVDMDGTFLNDQKEYNRPRFARIFAKLQEKGIKFVVASGNQYFQLKSFFPDLHEEIAFVSENGANILIGTTPFFNGELPFSDVRSIVTLLDELQTKKMIICGKDSAYTLPLASEEFFERSKFYYPVIKRINTLDEIDDTIFKFALSYPANQVEEKLAILESSLKNKLIPVSSGHGDIDLIIPGIHKAYGLKKLQELWQIDDTEVAAFGDSGNDLEMIAHAHFSYAMENAQAAIKKAARFQIGHNNTEALLDTIESLID